MQFSDNLFKVFGKDEEQEALSCTSHFENTETTGNNLWDNNK